ncbi:MAG: isoprenylcysteine carboxylmethyltransferase family protein [Candidatus Eremiobacteraeota bacterium]|nr:isoprenylcysteine carboxylmethyltransferase family protein [Candidatus Eremiobacteraeota bacterium]
MTSSPSESPQLRAPWYFRKRFTVFGLMYGLSFPLGFLISGVTGMPPMSAYASTGHPLIFGAIALSAAVGGYAVRVWASSYLAASIVWQQDVQLSTLRSSGPYRFTRNPLYLGNLLQALGMGLFGTWAVLALLLTSMLIFTYALIRAEESFLSWQGGSAYEQYCAAVARLMPLPWKIAPARGQRGELRDGLRSELGTAGVAAAAIMAMFLTWPR